MKRRLAALLAAVAVLAAWAAACSPEATRARGAGPGADVGNYSRNLPEPSIAPRVEGG